MASVQQVSAPAVRRVQLHAPTKRRRDKRIPIKDLSVAMRQLSTMISSGLSLVRALSVLAQQTTNPALQVVVGEVRDDVERGRSLSDSMGKHPKSFGRLAIAMVRAGETGGILDRSLTRLAHTFEKEANLRRTIKSAMSYPIVIGALSGTVVIAMLTFIVPMFETLYSDLGDQPLPGPTKILLRVSRSFRTAFPLFALAAVALVFGFVRWRRSPGGRRTIDRVLLSLPVFGNLFSLTALARFSRTFASMTRAGVPILQSLDICKDTAANSVIGDAIGKVQDSVRSGGTIAKEMGRQEVFPPMLVQMIAVGEETGAVDEMCEKVAEHFENEVEAVVSALTSLIEPILIAFLGVVIGGMITTLYLPMFKLVEAVG